MRCEHTPVYTAEFEILTRLTGFALTRGLARLEAVAEIVYIAVAVVGICAGGNVCLNIILSHPWEIETVQFMNNAVGCNVFTGICCLLMLMLGLLDKEEGSEAK